MIIHNRTKIVCTIGPASANKTTLKQMVKAGMDVARLNFSHGTYADFKKMIRNLREVSKELDVPVAIMQDLQGPKIRIGELPEKGITLTKGQEVNLSPFVRTGTEKIIPLDFKQLVKEVQRGDRVLLKDGLIELTVTKVAKGEIICKALNSGTLTSNAGISVPTASIKTDVITAKDKKDLAFGLGCGVDFVAMSFVKSEKDIVHLRNLIKKLKGNAKIIAKIERREAVKNLDAIIRETDAVMVARGDLGVEVSPQQVPLIQKKIIHEANLHGKPVITATEMLLSMVASPRATRAEISDAANAIFDHSDALMLSNETATGKYPVEAVTTLNDVAVSTENELKKHEHFLPNRLYEETLPPSYAVCSSAARLAENMKAAAIVTLTLSGFTAQHIAKHRVYIPHIVITPDPKVERQLQLVWGINKTIVQKIDFKNFEGPIRKILKKYRLGKKGDKIVVISNASTEEKLISVIIL